MTRGTKQKIVVVFLPAPSRPVASAAASPAINWFRLPKECLLHMVLNPQHLLKPDDEREVAVRSITQPRSSSVKDREVAIEEPALSIDDDDDGRSVRSGYSESAASQLESERSASPPRRPASAFPPPPSQQRIDDELPPRRKRPRSPSPAGGVIDVDEEDDRQRWKYRLRAMDETGAFEIPKNIDDVPVSQLRRIYDTNMRCVQIDSLVKWYSATLLMLFVAVDIVTENFIGLDMERYVDIQLKQMHVYRYYLRRIAEKQVNTARSGGIFGQNQNPLLSIAVTFSVTTIGFFAVRIGLRNKAAMVMNVISTLFGSRIQTASTDSAPVPQFSPVTTIMSALQAGAPSPPPSSSSIPRPEDMGIPVMRRGA